MIYKKENVAVFGLGHEQVDGIKNLKSFFSVYGFEDNKSSHGIKYVDHYVQIPLKEKHKILKYLKQKKINHLFSFCSEATINLLYFLYVKLGTNKNYRDLIKKVCNKNTLRRKLLNHNVINPNFSLLKTKKQFAVNKIIKPIFGSGSKNIVLIDKNNFNKLRLKNHKNCIIEDYIRGKMYAIDGFCLNNKFHGLALSKKFRDKKFPLIDKKIIFNFKNNDLFYKANILAQKCCTALNAQNVPIHFEFIVTPGGKLYPIDFAIRGAGSGIFNYCLTQLMSNASTDYQIKLQLNKEVVFNKKKKVFFYIYFLTSNKKVFMKKINLNFLIKKKFNYKVVYNKKIGEKINPVKSTHDRLGTIYFKFYSYNELIKQTKIINNYLDNIQY